jgi:hypothetical protein
MTIEDAKIQVPISDLLICEEILERQRKELGDYREKLCDANKEKGALYVEINKLNEIFAIKLAACGVIADCNTKESFDRNKVSKESPYWSPAYESVERCVQREIKLLEKVKKLEKDSKKLHYLERAGVDNWDGYNDAMEMLDDEE